MARLALLVLALLLAGCVRPAPASAPADFARDASLTPASPLAAASGGMGADSGTPQPFAIGPRGAGALHPGLELFVAGGGHDCTAAFAFQNGSRLFLATAAHCLYAGTLEQATCATPLPLLSPKEREVSATLPGDSGAKRIGQFVYDSFRAMQAANVTETYACYYDDFGLIEVDEERASEVSASLPGLGLPVSLRTQALAAGEVVQMASGLHGFSAVKQGFALSDHASSMARREIVFTAIMDSPCEPGDSGAPVIDADGNAVGLVLTRPEGAAGLCGIGRLGPMVGLAQDALGLRLTLLQTS